MTAITAKPTTLWPEKIRMETDDGARVLLGGRREIEASPVIRLAETIWDPFPMLAMRLVVTGPILKRAREILPGSSSTLAFDAGYDDGTRARFFFQRVEWRMLFGWTHVVGDPVWDEFVHGRLNGDRLLERRPNELLGVARSAPGPWKLPELAEMDPKEDGDTVLSAFWRVDT